MLKGFKDFLLRGNVVDLAVAVVVGMAFSQIVDALATDVIGGLIGVIGGVPDFGDAGITANGGKVVLGSTVNAVVNFLIVSAVVYFAVVVPVQRLMERRGAGEEPEAVATPEDIALLREIRDLLAARSGQG
jgi:large conductance mechanosensitive channel